MPATLAYSTTTGGSHANVTDDVVIEHHRPGHLRVTDPRYGLKTVAKERHDEVARAMFLAGRMSALVKQRDGVQARLTNLRREVRKIQANASTLTDETSLREAIAKLERMGATEARLVTDIARLSAKIGV